MVRLMIRLLNLGLIFGNIDFELDNFTPIELKNAINEVCSTDFSLNDIQEIVDSCDDGEKIGIKSLGDEVEENKISINLKAFDNLVKYYEDTNVRSF